MGREDYIAKGVEGVVADCHSELIDVLIALRVEHLAIAVKIIVRDIDLQFKSNAFQEFTFGYTYLFNQIILLWVCHWLVQLA